jgi:pimeloyl-ACP methyl ester carboxylesterase
MDMKEAFFDTGEMRLRYAQGPRNGPPLVLLHGATGNWRSWSLILPALVPHWQVYALELRGHGESGRAAGPAEYHVSYFVRDVLAFLRTRVGPPAVLVGHSWGAVIALLCGAPGKEHLRGLVLEDPPMMIRRPNTESKPFLDFFAWAYHIKQSAATVEDVIAALQVSSMGGLPPEKLKLSAQSLFDVDGNYLLSTQEPQGPVKGVDFEHEIQGIACPILLQQADLAKGAALQPLDLDFVLHHARDARVVRFPGAGHGIHDEQTAEFLAALETFFQTLPPISGSH